MTTIEDVCLVNYSIFVDINVKPNLLPDFFPDATVSFNFALFLKH